MKTRIVRAFSLLALPLLAAGCALNPFGSDLDNERDELRDARRLWESSQISNYEMVVQSLCFCGETRAVRVTVADGVPVSHVYADTGEPMDPRFVVGFDTVEELFDRAEAALDEGAQEFSARYHDELGYPQEIEIDHRANTADDEVTFTALVQPSLMAL